MNQKILIVEDEAKLAELLRDYLQQAGFAVSIVSDGRDAIPAVRELLPDKGLIAADKQTQKLAFYVLQQFYREKAQE